MDTGDNNDKNPLQLYIFSETKNCKTSGRPRKEDNIIFSTPPRSIVSLLLSKKTIPVDNTDVCNINMTNLCEKKDEKQWLCRQCTYRTFNKDTYKEHMISHKNGLRYCDYSNCIYSTKSSSNLIKHKRTHISEKPYICDKCVFRTNFQNSLTVHKRIHTLERPYACQFCEYRCNSSSNLKKHCAYRHKKTLSIEVKTITQNNDMKF